MIFCAWDRRHLARVALSAALLVACGTPRSRTVVVRNVPPFDGRETESWLVQETAPVDRDDVLPAFEESAQAYGCQTDHIGEQSSTNIYGEARRYYGVSASCREGTIALITLVGGSVSIGCAKPTTPAACDRLLHDIAQAR
jgi:hypothetical protein